MVTCRNKMFTYRPLAVTRLQSVERIGQGDDTFESSSFVVFDGVADLLEANDCVGLLGQ